MNKELLLESINEHFPEIAYRYVSAYKLGKEEWAVTFKEFNPELFDKLCMYCGKQWRKFGHLEECPLYKKGEKHD